MGFSMDNTTTPRPEPSKRMLLASLERYASNALLGVIVATFVLLVGQYTGASSVASAMQQEHMDSWASHSPAHAAAMAEYLACNREGPELTKKACVERAAIGQLAAELDGVATTPRAAWEAMPLPLRWFLN